MIYLSLVTNFHNLYVVSVMRKSVKVNHILTLTNGKDYCASRENSFSNEAHGCLSLELSRHDDITRR